MRAIDDLVHFEQISDRLKVSIPVRVNWLLFSTYLVSLIVWLIMLTVVLIYLISGRSSSLVLTVLLLLWLLVWAWFGRFLWNRWIYHAANREILYIDDEQLIVRRPVSIFGQTITYDMQYVSRFYLSETHKCPAFDYAYLHVYFGQSLPAESAEELVKRLNTMFFEELESD